MKKSPTTVTKKQGWGGKRAGSGRKPGPYAGTSKVTTIVLTAALIEKLHKLNGDGYTWRKFFKNHDVRIRDDVGSLADQAADAAGASR